MNMVPVFLCRHVALATVLLAAAAGARRAEACSCFANPPCAAVWNANAVFVGTVIDRVQEPLGGSISWTVYNVSVNQRLHGAVDSSFITIVPSNRPPAEQNVLGVNARLGPTLSSPYAATYFPGVDRKEAQAIDIADGERKRGFTIVATPLSETTVSGLVLFDDDRPAVNARVTAWTIDHTNLLSHADAHNSGAFILRVLTGITYFIRASARTESGLRETETVVFVDQEKEGVRLVIRP